GARSLAPVKQREQPRERRVDRRRHGEPRKDQDRKGDHDAEISELLQDVIAPRLVAFGKAEPQVIGDRARNRLEVGEARPKGADVAAEDEVREIEKSVEDENPGEEEMP